jgi:invasion protein IalB
MVRLLRSRAAAVRAAALALSCVLILCSSISFVGAVGAQQTQERAKSKSKSDATSQPAPKPVIPTWAVVCPATVQGGLACYATQTAINPPQATPNLRVNGVLRVSSETKKPELVFLLPLGIYLPSGVTVKFGDSTSKAVAIETCNPNGCLVKYPAKDDEIAALQKGTDVTLSVRTPDKRTYTFTLPSRGFKAAYAKVTSE